MEKRGYKKHSWNNFIFQDIMALISNFKWDKSVKNMYVLYGLFYVSYILIHPVYLIKNKITHHSCWWFGWFLLQLLAYYVTTTGSLHNDVFSLLMFTTDTLHCIRWEFWRQCGLIGNSTTRDVKYLALLLLSSLCVYVPSLDFLQVQ